MVADVAIDLQQVMVFVALWWYQVLRSRLAVDRELVVPRWLNEFLMLLTSQFVLRLHRHNTNFLSLHRIPSQPIESSPQPSLLL